MDMSGLNLSETPSGVPPPGVIPNFVNPPTRAPIANVFVSVTLALMIIFVAFRFYADVWVLRKLEKAGCTCFLYPFNTESDCHRVDMLILFQGYLLLQWYEGCAKSLEDDFEAYPTLYRQHPYPTVL